MTKVEPGQLWEWKNGAFTGTRFLVMEVNYPPFGSYEAVLCEDWTHVEIQEFVGGRIIPRTVTASLVRGARPL